jgi:hypothetical protein
LHAPFSASPHRFVEELAGSEELAAVAVLRTRAEDFGHLGGLAAFGA